MKEYTLQLTGYCYNIKAYEVNEEAANYWREKINDGDESELSEYMWGDLDDENPIPEEAKFLNGEDECDASCLQNEFTVLNLSDCLLTITTEDSEENIDLDDDDCPILYEWLEADTLPSPALIVSDHMKGIVMKGEFSLEDGEELDKSKITIVISEQEFGDQILEIRYGDKEIDILDWDLTGKGRYYYIVD